MTRAEKYVALADLAGTRGWPSRPVLWEVVKRHRIKRYKFAGDKKTYVLRAEIERAVRTPQRRP